MLIKSHSSSFYVHSVPASSHKVADSKVAVTSSPADQTEVKAYCRDGFVTSLILFYDPKSELSSQEKFMTGFYDVQFRHAGTIPCVITPHKRCV